MELMKTSMAAVLRILLTLTLLSGLSQAAATTSVPEGIDMGGDFTFADDEDIDLYDRQAGVEFILEFLSNNSVGSRSGQCFESDESRIAAVKKSIRTKLLSDLRSECQCIKILGNDNIITKEKLECQSPMVVSYFGVFPSSNFPTYSMQKLEQFLKSWTAVIVIEGSAVNPNFQFNVTSIQAVIMSDDTGSPTDGDLDDSSGSGEMSTEEIIDKPDKEEDTRNIFVQAGLEGISAAVGLSLHHLGLLLSLCAAFAAAVYHSILL